MITAPSANPAGANPASSAEEVRSYFPEMFILEGEESVAELAHEKPSTYLDIRSFPFKLVREGAVTRDLLLKSLGNEALVAKGDN